MIEEDYIFIRQLESENHAVLRRVSDIDKGINPNDIMVLHSDIETILDKIQNIIKNKIVKSQRALELLEMMKRGYIEILVSLDELMN